MRSRPHRFSDPQMCVKCTRCRALLHVNGDESFLAMIGRIVKLRCQEPECGFEDWYLESEFYPNPACVPLPASPSQDMISSY